MNRTNKNEKNKIGIKQVLLGSMFLRRDMLNWFPLLVLLAVLGILLISNRYKGEKILRETVIVQEQVKELRSESTTLEAELMNMSRYSEVLREVNRRGLGLKQPNVPPRKIKVKKDRQ